jgi:hypothetical protein
MSHHLFLLLISLGRQSYNKFLVTAKNRENHTKTQLKPIQNPKKNKKQKEVIPLHPYIIVYGIRACAQEKASFQN